MVFSAESQRSQRISTDWIISKGRKRGSLKKFLVTIFYLRNSKFIVVRCNRYVAAIDDLQSWLEGIYLHWNIVATIKGQTTRTGTNSSRAETSTRTIRGPGILQTVTGFHQLTTFIQNSNLRKVHQQMQYQKTHPCLDRSIEAKEVWQKWLDVNVESKWHLQHTKHITHWFQRKQSPQSLLQNCEYRCVVSLRYITFIYTRINRLIRIPDIVERHLIRMVMSCRDWEGGEQSERDEALHGRPGPASIVVKSSMSYHIWKRQTWHLTSDLGAKKPWGSW